MRFARLKLFLLSLLLGPVVLVAQVFAADVSSEQMAADLGNIKTRLTALEAGQKEIIAKEEKILEELDRVRIWVHRK